MSLEEEIEIANPQHPHCATLLLLDSSGSMAGDKISQLNGGLRAFKDDVEADDLARKRVDLCVVSFGGSVEISQPFTSVDDFDPPELEASGDTPMGEAINTALDLLSGRKQEYRQTGMDYYRPWVFLITDGEPTDMHPGDGLWDTSVQRIHTGEQKREFLFFAVGVDPANMELLRQIAPPERVPIRLQEGRFREMFQWLSSSQKRVSASKVGEQVALDSAEGWGEISTY